MRIAPELEWLRPYIKKAKKYIPRGKRIIQVRHTKLNHRTVPRYDAQVGTSDNRNYDLGIYTHFWKRHYWGEADGKALFYRTEAPYSKLDILRSLAHEISHLVYWHHTPDREKLENRIMNSFMTMLNNEGYVSEEKELHKRRKDKYE